MRIEGEILMKIIKKLILVSGVLFGSLLQAVPDIIKSLNTCFIEFENLKKQEEQQLKAIKNSAIHIFELEKLQIKRDYFNSIVAQKNPLTARSYVELIKKIVSSSYDPSIPAMVPVGPHLEEFLQNICRKNNMQVPKVVIDSTESDTNASAKEDFIVLSKGLVLNESDAEIYAVIAHELGHIKYNHIELQREFEKNLETFLF